MQTLTEEEEARFNDLDRQCAFLPGFLCGEDESEVESFKQYAVEVGSPFKTIMKLGETDSYHFFYTEPELFMQAKAIAMAFNERQDSSKAHHTSSIAQEKERSTPIDRE